MKFLNISLALAAAYTVSGQSFCSTTGHTGESIKVTSNKVGNIGDIGYELWSDSGNNSATFYSDGSLSCSFNNAKDYLCRSGLSFDSTQTHDQIGHMYADFKLVKQNVRNVDYSYVGIYGWSRDPLVEYYVVDDWLSQWRPGDWVGNKKHGDFTIDGAQYTVFENTRYGPSIDGDTTFKQFFSIRKEARSCGTIDITAHFQQWEKLGMKLGKMHEAKVLGEAGSTGSGTSGTADFPYAKVYIKGGQSQQQQQQQQPATGSCSASILAQGYKCCPSNCEVIYTDADGTWGAYNGEWCGCGNNGQQQQPSTGSCSASILAQGYKCCPSNCQVVYTDADGTWGVNNGEWCGCGGNSQQPSTGSCSASILAQGYKCCPSNCQVVYTDADGTWGVNNGEWCGCGGNSQQQPVTQKTTTTIKKTTTTTVSVNTNFCASSKHSGESVKVTSNKVGSIGDIGYELWADSGNNSATFYSDGSFSCSFQNAKDYLCRSGLSFDSTKTHDQIGHMYADFKLVKQNIQNVDYSYVGIYGWSRDPLVEYYIVDNWLSQWRPGDWVGNKKHGDFTIDGAKYTVYENTRYGPSIDGDTTFKQFFSIRQTARDCGTIDITAHIQQWEKLGMKLGKMHEAKVLGEAGSNGSGTSGTADFPYARVYIGQGNSGNTGNTGNNSSNNTGNNNAATTTYPKGTGFQFYTQCKNRNHWALTYDDGPTQYADAILDLLKKYNIKATFFLVGNMYIPSTNSEWSRIVKRMYNEGHVIGSHTFSHNDLTGMSQQQIVQDMQKIEDAIYNAIGKKPAFMRPPYGSGNGNQTVMNTLKNFGINAACNWHVDPMDWDNGGNVNYAKQVLSKLNGEGVITLNHLQYNGASKQGILDLATAEIELMLAKGYKPVTMEECLGMSAYKN